MNDKLKKILNKIELYAINDNIFLLSISDQKLRANVFMRYQEFYESTSDKFRNKPFKIKDYKKWYINEGPTYENNNNKFTYHIDWVGFNIPSEVIIKCRENIPDYNIYDQIMDKIIQKIGIDKFYLIGAENLQNLSILDHELAHAFYYLYPEYKSEMNKYLDFVDNATIEQIYKLGYSKETAIDELHAYSATGSLKHISINKDINYKPIKDLFLKSKNKYIKTIWKLNLN